MTSRNVLENNLTAVHVGPQKAATTWLYENLKRHPEICVAKSDAVHYFDIHYARGYDWYASQFERHESGQKIVEFTPSYLRSTNAIRRLAHDFPDIKLIMSLRDPLERAFSHYWHEKKKKRIDYSFSEVLANYDLYQNWIESSLYSLHIERILECFLRRNVLFQKFSDLQDDPERFFRQACRFLEVSENVELPSVSEKVNQARPSAGSRVRKLAALARKLNLYQPSKKLYEVLVSGAIPQSMEYLEEVDEEVVAQLNATFREDLVRVEELTGIRIAGGGRK
jgi:hypothetical protein